MVTSDFVSTPLIEQLAFVKEMTAIITLVSKFIMSRQIKTLASQKLIKISDLSTKKTRSEIV